MFVFVGNISLLQQECRSFEENPRDPGNNANVVSEPWSDAFNDHCKLFVTFPGDPGAVYHCSGVLVGPYHLLTARHCKLHACLGLATSIRVRCGYGYGANLHSYASFGTAIASGQVVRYRAYDDDLECVDNTHRGPADWDIQYVRLDRRIGDRIGWKGLTTATQANVHVVGYPGHDNDLEPFIPNHGHQQLHRFLAITSSTDRAYRLDGAWIFGGESGGAYYRLANSRQVNAVHVGGRTGCRETGCRVTPDFFQDYLALRGSESTSQLDAWDDPPSHCQVLWYERDIFDAYEGTLDGVGRASPDFAATSVFQGANFKTKITLFNVGADVTTEVTLRFYASVDQAFSPNNDIFLGRSTPYALNSGASYRRSTSGFVVSWLGVRHIIATWTTRYACNQLCVLILFACRLRLPFSVCLAFSCVCCVCVCVFCVCCVCVCVCCVRVLCVCGFLRAFTLPLLLVLCVVLISCCVRLFGLGRSFGCFC